MFCFVCEVEEFDKIASEIMNANPKTAYAGVNLILEDAQHPISARVRQSDGSTVSDRKLANVSHSDSVCYYLVHDPSKDVLIREMPLGNPFGPTYIGYVIKDSNGERVGAVCQVTELRDEEDTQQQTALLKSLAAVAEAQLAGTSSKSVAFAFSKSANWDYEIIVNYRI